jgi:hypothetical protein
VCVLVLQASSQFTHTVDPFIDWTVLLSITNDSYSVCVLDRPLNDAGEVNYRNEIQPSVVPLSSAQSQTFIDREKAISHLNHWFNLRVVCQFSAETAIIT